jgi:glycosyltransferase involved in cell wall biosynthesis
VSEVFFVVPDGIDDPARPSGGNRYDRRLSEELRAQGWEVREREVAGFLAAPDAMALGGLWDALRDLPDGATVLIDGLITSTAPEVLVPQAERLRLVPLVHMPLGQRPAEDAARAWERERAVLTAAAATVTTSEWTRRLLIELYDLPADRVRAAEPGVDQEASAPATQADDRAAGGSEAGGALLCVGPVTFAKSHDLLLDALESIASLDWHCTCVGSLDRDPAFANGMRERALDAGLGERVAFTGTLTGDDLDDAYAWADLLVVASRAETYGMVVTEALARGVPVVAAGVGGVEEAVGEGADGSRPGILVAPEDPTALADALRSWLTDDALRTRLRRSAAERRESLPRWSTTASIVASVLAQAAV